MTAPRGDGGAVASEAPPWQFAVHGITFVQTGRVFGSGPDRLVYTIEATAPEVSAFIAAAARPAPAGEAAEVERLQADLELAQSIAGGEITEQEWRSQAEIDRLTRALTAAEAALAQARAKALEEAAAVLDKTRADYLARTADQWHSPDAVTAWRDGAEAIRALLTASTGGSA